MLRPDFGKNAPQKYKQTNKNTEQDLVQNIFFEQSLLKIKNNKTPGTDSFSGECFYEWTHSHII